MEQNEMYDFPYRKREVFIKNLTLLALLLTLFSITLELFPQLTMLSSYSNGNSSTAQLSFPSAQTSNVDRTLAVPSSASEHSTYTQYETITIIGANENVGISGNYTISGDSIISGNDAMVSGDTFLPIDYLASSTSSSNTSVSTVYTGNLLAVLLYDILPSSLVRALFFILNYVPYFLLTLYVFILRPKDKSAAMIPTIYGILAFDFLFCSSLLDSLFFITLILVTISAIKGFPNRVFLYLSTGVGIIGYIYGFISSVDYFKLFFENGNPTQAFNVVASPLRAIALLLALCLLGINCKKPESITDECDTLLQEEDVNQEEIVEIS